MAEHAIGTECPKCKTLVACAGNRTDEELVGRCGCCGATVTVPNYLVQPKPRQTKTVIPVSVPLPTPAPQPVPVVGPAEAVPFQVEPQVPPQSPEPHA